MDLVSLKQRFGVIGNSELLNRALEVAVRVAPTDLSVLVTGESGVGKEFFRRSSTPIRPASTINILPSTAVPSPKARSIRSCSATRRGRSRVPSKLARAISRRPTAGRFFWTRWPSCRSRRRCACCACCRRANSCASVRPGAAHRRAGRGGDEHEFAGGHREGAVPRRPLLPAQHGAHRGAGVARPARGHLPAVPQVRLRRGRTVPYAAHHARRRGAPDVGGLLLARQHPAVEERGRADLGHRGEPRGDGGDSVALPSAAARGFDARGDGGGRGGRFGERARTALQDPVRHAGGHQRPQTHGLGAVARRCGGVRGEAGGGGLPAHDGRGARRTAAIGSMPSTPRWSRSRTRR